MMFWFDRALLDINVSNICSRSADDLACFILENDKGFKNRIKAEQTIYAQNCLQIAKPKTRKEQEIYIKEANKYLTQEEIYMIIPPPSWKTVWGPKEYIGIGFTGGIYKDGGIPTAEIGKDILIGYRVTIDECGNDVEIYYENGWTKYKKSVVNINGTEDFFDVRVKAGKKFKVSVERFE